MCEVWTSHCVWSRSSSLSHAICSFFHCTTYNRTHMYSSPIHSLHTLFARSSAFRSPKPETRRCKWGQWQEGAEKLLSPSNSSPFTLPFPTWSSIPLEIVRRKTDGYRAPWASHADQHLCSGISAGLPACHWTRFNPSISRSALSGFSLSKSHGACCQRWSVWSVRADWPGVQTR